MYHGWRIAAASFFVLFTVVGMVYYGFPVFYAPLIDEFGWTRAQAAAGFFYGILLVGPAFGVSAGFLIDRYGARRVLLAGLVLEGAAFCGFAAMRSLTAYYLLFLVQAVGYVSSGPMPNQVLVSHWFNRMRGRAMGLVYTGTAVGGAVAPVLVQYIVGRWGWRSAMAALGGGILFVLVPAMIGVVRNRPSELGLHPDGDLLPRPPAPGAVAPDTTSLRKAAGTWTFWLILAGGALNSGAVGGVIQHLQLHLRDQGFAPEEAARAASLLLLSSIAGRFVMGHMADLFPKKHVMTAACLLVGLPVTALYRVDAPGAVVGFALVFGFGLGAGHMLLPLLTADCFGLSSLGRLMGVILTVSAISQAFTPALVGRLHDIQRNYAWGFAILMAMALSGAAAVSQIPSKSRVE